MKKLIVIAMAISMAGLFATLVSGAGTSGDDLMREEVLAAHNRFRTERDVPPLAWSEKLAVHATEWANHLARSGGRIYHSSGTGEGENLWWGTSGHFSYTQMVDAWGGEKRYYRDGTFPNVSTSGSWSDVGHYTQIIWRNTTEVGCAKATSGGYDIFVCRYSPPGNYVGQKVY